MDFHTKLPTQAYTGKNKINSAKKFTILTWSFIESIDHDFMKAGLWSFPESIDHDFVKALLIQTDNQIVI